jgi:2-oxoglutarate ferredoxin oxidoreductase subunit gamma
MFALKRDGGKKLQEEIIVSGFGGQGALFAGQLLAYAGMDEGKFVTWIPSYGPEMRGGTAHCTVIISDEEIGSPLVRNPSAAIVLNNPSMEKYELLVEKGGVLIVNRSLISLPVRRDDIRVFDVMAADIAADLGHVRMANVVCLGALLEATGVLPLAAVDKALQEHLADRHRGLLAPNRQALQRGAAEVRAICAA